MHPLWPKRFENHDSSATVEVVILQLRLVLAKLGFEARRKCYINETFDSNIPLVNTLVQLNIYTPCNNVADSICVSSNAGTILLCWFDK